MRGKMIIAETERLILRRYTKEELQDLKREFEALDIGYVLNRNYWRHGYAAESCKALIQQAFSHTNIPTSITHKITEPAKTDAAFFL